MGNSDEDPNKGINGSVGGLIWVRQRNGSWWPGKILDPDELHQGSVPSPRSGTPVKLLGKEGSNVGWYNLEKSKRVKAFRYDQDKCIKKFKASKHAKRCEAVHILELELESARLGKNHSDHESPSAFYLSEESEHLDKSSIRLRDDSGSGIKKREKSRENVSKRTRGLEDLGINVPLLPRKRKRSPIANNQEISKKKNKRRTLMEVLGSIEMWNPNEDSLLETRKFKEISSEVSCDDNLKSSKHKENGISSNTRQNESFGSLFDASEELGSSASPNTPNASRQAQYGVGTQPNQNSLIEIPSRQNKKHSKAGPTISDVKGVHPKWQSKGNRCSRLRKTYLLGPGRVEQNGSRSLPHRQSRFTVNPKYEPSSFSFRGSLHDVPLEVNPGPVRPHCVPYVSLASKLTGHPIMGHPIPVDALDDGSCHEYLNSISGRPGCGLLKKTRKLLALADVKKKGRVGEAKKGLSVACVPLGVVFSRLYAELGRSARPVSGWSGTNVKTCFLEEAK